MKIINTWFISILSGMIFFSILLLPILSDINLLSMLLLTFIFTPLLLSAFWQGIKSYIPIFISLITIAILNLEFLSFSIFIIVFFILPAFLLSFIKQKYKNISHGYILSIIIIYNVLICISTLFYFGFLEHTKSIHAVIVDTMTFLSILVNQYMTEEFKKITNLTEQIDIFSFIVPTILSILSIMWLFLNYIFSIKIATKSNIIENNEQTYYCGLPNFYTYIFMILIAITLFSHNFLDKNQNLYYTSYNVLFILCFGYFYSGFYFLWNKVKSRNSLLVNVLYLVFVIVLFVELVVLFSIIGLFIEIKKIAFRDKN